jgi:hypothetical protein
VFPEYFCGGAGGFLDADDFANDSLFGFAGLYLDVVFEQGNHLWGKGGDYGPEDLVVVGFHGCEQICDYFLGGVAAVEGGIDVF